MCMRLDCFEIADQWVDIEWHGMIFSINVCPKCMAEIKDECCGFNAKDTA